MNRRESSYVVVEPFDQVEHTRLSSLSGGYVSRNDLDLYLGGLISLAVMLGRTLSGAQARENDRSW
jgi:hypothetical protein